MNQPGKPKPSKFPGAQLVLFTDGIPEAQNEDGEFYGNERFMAVIGKGLIPQPRLSRTTSSMMSNYFWILPPAWMILR